MATETESKLPYQVFHSTCEFLRKHLHVVLVRPEFGGNVGSVARAMANTGIQGTLRIVGSPSIVDGEARKFAKHATPILEGALHFADLRQALAHEPKPRRLVLAATARIGSPTRPHPLWVRPAMERAMAKLKAGEVDELILVFGPESDGLRNDEVAQCDWVVTIPSLPQYRSLNLAQSVLIFCYEANLNLLEPWEDLRDGKPSQKRRLVTHMLQVAEDAGFILPGDPFKMRPRLEGIFSALPNHIKEVKTLHGLLDQISRSLKKGGIDLKGRYRHQVETQNRDPLGH